jgi:HemK-like putative methylase
MSVTGSFYSLALGSRKVEIELAEEVFAPTTTTTMLIRHMGDVTGRKVLDLGCGSGVIGVAAAILGAAKVVAVDVMQEAVALARRNVERNGVADRVDVRHSDLFATLGDEKFDLIVDDVSGIAEPVARVSSWYPPSIPSGGPDGTGPTNRMLEQAAQHLAPGGSLIFPVISLAAANRILDTARQVFGDGLKLLESRMIPFCPQLYPHVELLTALRERGVIDFEQRNSRLLWRLEIYSGTFA